MDLQPTRLPCPSPSPGVCPSSCPLNWWCHPTISSSAIHFSQHQVFLQWVSSSQQVAKVLALQHQFFDAYSGLISCRIDWFDLLAVQGTLKSLLQHHHFKASVLWLSAFFMVQLSHPDMTTGKNIVLNVWTIVGKVMSLLFNALFRFIIAFLPRSKRLLNHKSV